MLGMDGYDRRLELNKLSAAVMLMAGLFMVISFYDVLVLFRDDLFGKSFVLSTICLRDDLPRLMRMARDTYLRANLQPAALVHRHLLVRKSGYELSYLYQLSCILWTSPGLTPTQNIYFALILNICIQYDVLELHLADLDALVKRADPHSQDRLVRQKLHQIILYQTRLEQFVQLIERVYSPQAIVKVLSLTFHLVMTLYVMRTSIWLPGVFLIPLCTIQLLLIFCIPGTLIELKASKLTESIYDTAWHEMHQQNQQIVHLLLHRKWANLCRHG
uniref:Gustatory receptor n=1 Tax=Anopheles arabiensis TaxID=7173 RepID=A0A182IIU8_ANOAR